ncbi:MAG: hypothetical protein GAK35_02373 [Herbaspirillum frisingense]|uniref:Phage portal protein n=1 Tax=Herbaspirillum frisingense TaxID=92645 RepID=A0A7V8FW60_9BURK|nr:MAG: hypothetical protein GAK35_02373 [Herbaspirillum frisingense]
MALVPGTPITPVDAALQISTVWACVDRRGSLLASLPIFVYRLSSGGERQLARTDRLYQLLHDSPNARMTPFEFWRAMMLNYDLRGNAYARIDRASNGEAVALWPMPADQVEPIVLPDGSMVYKYTLGANVIVYAAESVLHLKNLGNGTTGLSKLEFMASTTDEMQKAQQSASQTFGNGGKPTGVLMIDKVLNKEQRAALKKNFAELAVGHINSVHLLEANMKYQQLSLTPMEQQLLETRKYGVEEICRWFDVPPVLVHHANVTSWGSGIFEIKDGFYTLSLAPLAVNLVQAIRKRVLTPMQRATMTVEVSLDALMRASIKDRYEIYGKAVQNGIKTRNEVRQLENDPPMAGGDQLTAQSNLVPLDMLGKVQVTSGGSGETIKQ